MPPCFAESASGTYDRSLPARHLLGAPRAALGRGPIVVRRQFGRADRDLQETAPAAVRGGVRGA
jgi:hypothetical protein